MHQFVICNLTSSSAGLLYHQTNKLVKYPPELVLLLGDKNLALLRCTRLAVRTVCRNLGGFLMMILLLISYQLKGNVFSFPSKTE